ncbi:MAG: SprT family zinc-dependent metalloprotease [Marinifilaceae bacterium]
MSTNKTIKSEIRINDIDVLVYKKDIKNFHLNVLPPDGKVRVSVPFSTSEEAVRLFVITRLPWIRKQIKNFQEQARQTERQYISGESHYFKGDRYLLNVIENDGRSKLEIRGKKYIDLYVKADTSVDEKERVFDRWYRREMKTQLPHLFEKWEKVIGVHAEEVVVRKIKVKWGTCMVSSKKISLNIDLIKKPSVCLEYIIVHELIHLLEEKHNDVFVSYIDRFMPKWRIYKKELNEAILGEF